MTSIPPQPDYTQLIGLSALIGAGFSALVNAFLNYYTTIRINKKQNQTKLIEEKLSLYSIINFYLDKMRFRADAIKEHTGVFESDKRGKEAFAFSVTDNELQNIIVAINEIIKDKYYLFRQDILKEWVYITVYFADPSVIDKVPNLRQMVVDEYNNNVVPEYEKLTGKKIARIS